MAGSEILEGSGALDLAEMIQLMKDTTGCGWQDPVEDEARKVTEETKTQRSTAQNHDGDSDDSTGGIILNASNYNKKPQKRQENNLNYKMNKAQEIASRDPEPSSLLKLEELQQVTWPELDLPKGGYSPNEMLLTPWKLVKCYPDLYVGKRSRELLADSFSEKGIHENRVWDLFYLYHPKGTTKKPILFVLAPQFEHYLDILNAKFNIHLTIPVGKEGRFRMSFGDGNTPKPRFLGRSTDQETFQDLCTSIPGPLSADMDLEKASPSAAEEFLWCLEVISNADKRSKTTKKSQKNQNKRVETHKGWGEMVKRVQRYLGLRQKKLVDVDGPEEPETLDTSRPLRTRPEGAVIFVAVDIEAYEFNQDIITEVGIAVLDTEDIQCVAPEEGGAGWFQLIKAHHFRIKENAWVVNKQYVRGCPQYFNFGTSRFLQLEEVAKALEEIIVVPSSSGSRTEESTRRVVLVFHDPAQDIKYLNSLSFDIFKFGHIVETIDTREMHQYVARAPNPAKLNTVLASLGISSVHLHNAGNDAVYTMQAMISLAMKKRLASLEKAANKSNLPLVKRADAAANEGWSSGGEDSDGGMPHRPVGTPVQLANPNLNPKRQDNISRHSTSGNPAVVGPDQDDEEDDIYPKNVSWGN